MTSRHDVGEDLHDSLPPLVAALRDGACFDHPTNTIVVLETHISWVLLTGPYAYKIKKPVTLPFLDFSTLDFRKHYCEEELRLNRRMADELYLGVVPITGTPKSPRVNGDGNAIEYAVKMVQFPDADRLDRVADRGELHATHVSALAEKIARFHDRIAIAPETSPFADSERLRRESMENFESLAAQTLSEDAALMLEEIRSWSAHSLVELGRLFRARKHTGKIRECHGDMHLANMALFEDKVTIFDALEFNENLRWIDVQSELAFLAMDLDYRGLTELGWLLLSGYLESSGDYAGLKVFRHYKVYRAVVRAKVAGLRAQQCADGTAEHEEALAEVLAHVRLAHALLETGSSTPIVVTHGLSGSGKSWLSERLLRVIGAVRVRSDVERRRLAEAGDLERDKLYSPSAVTRVYERLAEHARAIVESGYPVIVDATFLKRKHRLLFLSLARELGVPFVILSVHAPERILEARVEGRRAGGGDVSEATVDVLHAQRRDLEALDEEEREITIDVDGGTEPDLVALARRIARDRGAPLVRRLDTGVRDEY